MKKNYFMPFLSPKKYKKALLVGLLALPVGYPPLPLSAKELSIFEQSYSLNLKFRNESLGSAIEQISRQAHVRIIYSNDQVDTRKKVNADIQTSDIREALLAVLGDGYAFKQENNYITILRVKSESSAVIASQQKKSTVTGLLTDADGNPIIGATVGIKGTTHGVTTDMDGRYILNDVTIGDIIEFRYIGMVTEERTYKGEETINIRMLEASVSLDDVVVIGYGQQKKESVVSSLNTIGPKELTIKQRNLRNVLAGQIAGVIAVQRSGEPGNDAAAFYIRGQSSYAGGTNPLVLVDGVPRDMDDIDVDEIESFTVLKDASATAVYGAEGANGVVLITSKRGMVQKTQVSFSAQYSIVTPTRMPETLNAYDYLSLYNEAVWNDQGNPTNFNPQYSQEVLDLYRTGADPDLYPSVNWYDLLQEHTQSQRYTVNFRGGSEKVRFFASGAYYSEDGIFDSNPTEKYNANIGLQRFNLRSNVDMDLTKTTQLSIDMSGQYLRKNQPGYSSDEIFDFISHFPVHVIPMYYSDGTFSDHGAPGYGVDTQPYNMLNNSGYNKTWSAFLQTKTTLRQKLDFITEGLSVKGSVSFDADFTSTMARSKTPQTFYALGRNEDGTLNKKTMKEGAALGDPYSYSTGGTKKIYIEASLDYARTFNKVHDVTGMILYMQKETQYQNKSGLQLLPYRKQSVVARATYGYDDRYMIEASMGMTGSENFAQGHRWGIFPAVGAAWFISHEKFMQGVEDYLSKLKLRISYGITGNDNIGESTRFPYRESINTGAGGYNFGLTPGANGGASNSPGSGIVEGSFPMPNLSWEIEKKLNAGIDVGLFRGRVDFSADYFFNRRSDILLQRRTVSNVTGFRVMPYQNFGIVNNQGIDANLILKQKVGEVDMSARGNLTFARNKIIEYDEVPQRYAYQNYTGNSIGDEMLYIAEGLYTPDDFDITTDAKGAQSYELKEGMPVPAANVSPGDIKYKDLNNDGVINDYDRTYDHGFYNKLPEIVYGFGLNAEWKGFFVGVFFQGTAHASANLLANTTNMTPFAKGVDNSSARIEALDRWTAENPYNQNVFYPRLHAAGFDHNMLNSTYWRRDAGFLRLKNIEIGYEFNDKVLRSLKMKNLRIYLQGNNVAVWDHIKLWDPELGDANSGAKYPICSNYTVGLEVTF